MTNAEYFNQVTGTQEESHLQAFGMIISELEAEYTKFNFDYWRDKYIAALDWLNSEKSVNAKEVQQ